MIGRDAPELVVGRVGADADKVPVLRAYLKRWKAEVGVFFDGVSGKSPESELRRISPDHPVFLVQQHDQSAAA